MDIAGELGKKKTMEHDVIVIGSFGIVTKGLVHELEDLEIRGRVETIQTTALLKSARTLRRVLETWGDLMSLKFHFFNLWYYVNYA